MEVALYAPNTRMRFSVSFYEFFQSPDQAIYLAHFRLDILFVYAKVTIISHFASRRFS